MYQKGFTTIVLITVALIIAGIAGYLLVVSNSTEPQSNWQSVDADSFTLSLPSGWEFNKLQGFDSYVGEFVGDGIRLTFDFGWYSNPLVEDNDPNHIVTYEIIDGYQAKLVFPKTDGHITGVYFGDLGNQNRFNLSGNNLTSEQQEIALKIFRTIHFKK